MRCRQCGEAIIVMKDSGARPGSPVPKNLFDLRSVLRRSEREPSRFFEEKTPTPPAQEPEIPETEAVPPPEEPAGPTMLPEEPREEEPAEPAAGEAPPGVESPDESVSLRMTEEAPREAEPETAEPPPVEREPFAEQEPEEGEPRVPETEAVTPPEEPSVPQEPEATEAWEPPPVAPAEDVERSGTDIFSFEEERKAAEEKPFELMLNDVESLDFLKEDYQRASTEGELDISGILRSDPSPEPEPVEPLFPVPPERSPGEEPMPDRVEAIQRELQEIGGGSPDPAEARSPAPAAVPSVPPARKTPPPSPNVAARPGSLRRGRPSLVPLVILFLLIAGGGAYLGFTPGGQEILRRMVPAMESLWLGGESAKVRYAVGNLVGYYEPDAKAGTLFVIQGTVTNQGRETKSGIRVWAELFDSGGTHIAGKSVFAGNVLPGEVLRSSSKEAIDKAMANRWGDRLSNLDIGPGKSIPFMIVFFDAPAGIGEYRLEARDGE